MTKTRGLISIKSPYRVTGLICLHAVSLSSNPQKFVEEPNQMLPDEVVEKEGAKEPGRNERVMDGYRFEQDEAPRRESEGGHPRGGREPERDRHQAVERPATPDM